MGVGASVWRSTDNFSHHHGGADHQGRLKRVDDYRNVDASSAAPANKCGMCQLNVDLGTVAYQCREEGCPLLLHATCYWRPKTLSRHLTHPDHRLTIHAADGTSHCSICTQQLVRLGSVPAPAFAYRCTSAGCAGFQAHPRCCDLPPEIEISTGTTTGHEHGRLVLRPAPSTGRRRHCLKCKRPGKTGARAPWSYQCLSCDKEVCVACLLNNDGRADPMQCCCACCVDVVSPGVVHCLGQAAGVFLCGLANGMGCPTGFSAPTTWRIQNVNGDN